MSEIRVVDESNEVWCTQIYTSKYKWLREGQLVKIRGVNRNERELASKEFCLRFASNIITIPSESQLERALKINSDKAIIQADREIIQQAEDRKVAHPFIATHITD